MNALWTVTGLSAAGCLAAGAGLWFLTPERLPAFERFTRNRYAGLLGGWAALWLCIPHAEVVSPAWLLPLLPVLAAVVPVLCFFYVEFLAARALAGLAILCAYYVVHVGFEFHLPGAGLLSIAAWLLGIAGIWVSGRPCSLRDFFRLGAANPALPKLVALLLVAFALRLLIAAAQAPGLD